MVRKRYRAASRDMDKATKHRLIQLVQQNPAIYDKNQALHTDVEFLKSTWKHIARQTCSSEGWVTATWAHFERRYQQLQKEGKFASENTKDDEFMKSLSFLSQ